MRKCKVCGKKKEDWEFGSTGINKKTDANIYAIFVVSVKVNHVKHTIKRGTEKMSIIYLKYSLN